MGVASAQLSASANRTKTKFLPFAIQNVSKAILESDQCATKTALKVIQTSLLSATSHRDMEEELDRTLNAMGVRSGVSCGIQSARRATTPLHAACASPSAQKACLISD